MNFDFLKGVAPADLMKFGGDAASALGSPMGGAIQNAGGFMSALDKFRQWKSQKDAGNKALAAKNFGSPDELKLQNPINPLGKKFGDLTSAPFLGRAGSGGGQGTDIPKPQLYGGFGGNDMGAFRAPKLF
jgi:hypothetical protein